MSHSVSRSPTAPDITVRPVKATDEVAWSALYSGYRAFYEEPHDDNKVAATWGFLLDPGNESTGLVAVDATGVIIGLAIWREFPRPLSADRGLYLDDLFVSPDARRQRAGERLIQALADIARERGCGVVSWITAEDNTTARQLYDRVATATQWVTYDLTP